MPELPHLTVPALIYNALVCGLATALSSHLVGMFRAWRRARRGDLRR